VDATPTIVPQQVSCTPPACAAGQSLTCGQADGCPGGCGTICSGPTVTPTPAVVAPTLTLTSSAAEIKVSEQVTFTGKSAGVGNPQYTLALQAASLNSIVAYSVTAGQTLPAQADTTAAGLDLVSATATQTDVTFVVKVALASGPVKATLATTGEVAGPGGAFVSGGSSAPPLTVNVTGNPAITVELAGTPTDVVVGQEFQISIPNVAIDTPPARAFGLTVDNGTTKQTLLSAPFDAERNKTLLSQPAPQGAMFELVDAGWFEGYVDFTLKALQPSKVTITAYAEGDVSGKSEPITFTVNAASAGGAGGGTGATYTVKAGDTLFSIGRALGVDWTLLASANGIGEPYLIHPGDTLAVPAAGGAGKYTVKAGDWLYKIARELGIDWAELARVNGLTAPFLVYPGDVLTLP